MIAVIVVRACVALEAVDIAEDDDADVFIGRFNVSVVFIAISSTEGYNESPTVIGPSSGTN